MSDLTVSVPPRVHGVFWRHAPGAEFCWLVRDPACCEVGGKIIWRMSRAVVAQATIAIVRPRPGGRWHEVLWDEASFEDLRDDLGPGFKPQLYGGYSWSEEPTP